jgi:hypothetical protein
MKVSCWQNHFLLLHSVPARQAGYAEALAGWALAEEKYRQQYNFIKISNKHKPRRARCQDD